MYYIAYIRNISEILGQERSHKLDNMDFAKNNGKNGSQLSTRQKVRAKSTDLFSRKGNKEYPFSQERKQARKEMLEWERGLKDVRKQSHCPQLFVIMFLSSSFLPSFFPSFLPSLLPSFLPPFLPSFLPSFLFPTKKYIQ